MDPLRRRHPAGGRRLGELSRSASGHYGAVGAGEAARGCLFYLEKQSDDVREYQNRLGLISATRLRLSMTVRFSHDPGPEAESTRPEQVIVVLFVTLLRLSFQP